MKKSQLRGFVVRLAAIGDPATRAALRERLVRDFSNAESAYLDPSADCFWRAREQASTRSPWSRRSTGSGVDATGVATAAGCELVAACDVNPQALADDLDASGALEVIVSTSVTDSSQFIARETGVFRADAADEALYLAAPQARSKSFQVVGGE